MTRSSRLLAVGIAVLAIALVVAMFAMRDRPDPIVVTEPATDLDVAAEVEDEEPEVPSGTVGALGEDEARLPTPLEIPEGHEAVAITASFDAAVAALPVPGDVVNVYGVFVGEVPEQLQEGDDDASKAVVRALDGVEVLGVTGAEAGAGGGNLTLVLALEPDDAERAIYLHTIERVYFSLVAADHEPVEGVGVTRDTVLD